MRKLNVDFRFECPEEIANFLDEEAEKRGLDNRRAVLLQILRAERKRVAHACAQRRARARRRQAAPMRQVPAEP